MSNAIQPIACKQSTDQVASAGVRASAKSATDTAPAATSAAQPPFCLNPSLHIDGALGLVVMEFYKSDGSLSTSIPTEHQLDAYRRAAGGVPRPVGLGRPADAAAGTGAVANGAGTSGAPTNLSKHASHPDPVPSDTPSAS